MIDKYISKIAELKRQLKIAELKLQGSVVNNLCADCHGKQVGKPCLGCRDQILTALENLPNGTVITKSSGTWFIESHGTYKSSTLSGAVRQMQ